MRGTVRAEPLTGADQVVATGRAVYCGYTVHATDAARVRVWDDPAAATGTLLDELALGAGESATAFYPGGIWAAKGLFVDVVSGTVTGSLRVG